MYFHTDERAKLEDAFVCCIVAAAQATCAQELSFVRKKLTGNPFSCQCRSIFGEQTGSMFQKCRFCQQEKIGVSTRWRRIKASRSWGTKVAMQATRLGEALNFQWLKHKRPSGGPISLECSETCIKRTSYIKRGKPYILGRHQLEFYILSYIYCKINLHSEATAPINWRRTPILSYFVTQNLQ